MKKLIVSTIAAAAIATTASADMKIGVGVDLMTSVANPVTASTTKSTIGSTPAIRIDVDGVVPGLRLEPTIAYISATNDAAGASTETYTAFGLNAYYDIAGPVSVGVLSNFGTSSSTAAGSTDTKMTKLGVVLKGEVELGKGFTVASELGLASNTTDTGAVKFSEIAPTTSLTLRYFF